MDGDLVIELVAVLALLAVDLWVIRRMVHVARLRRRPVHALRDDLRGVAPGDGVKLAAERYRWLSIPMMQEIAALEGLRHVDTQRRNQRVYLHFERDA